MPNPLPSAEFPKGKKLYAFDLDDTLINTREAYTSAISHGLESVRGLVPNRDAETDLKDLLAFCRAFGSSNTRAFATAFFTLRLESETASDEATEIFLEKYEERFWSKLTAFKGCGKMLKRLRSGGNRKICLITNASRERRQREKIRRTGLAEFFEQNQVFISGSFPANHHKPFPDMFKIAVHETQTEAKDALYCGNTPADMIAANLAGFSTLFFNHENRDETKMPNAVKIDYRLESWEGLFSDDRLSDLR